MLIRLNFFSFFLCSFLLLGFSFALGKNNNDGYLFVTNQGEDSLYVFDLSNKNTLVKKIDVGAAPAGIAISRKKRKVFVTNTKDSSISIVDINNLEIIDTILIDGSAVGIEVSIDEEELFVADWFNNTLIVFDIDTLEITNRIDVGVAPAGIVVSKNEKIYVVNRDSNSVSVISNKKKQVINEISAGDHPFGARLNLDEKLLFVTNVQSNDVSIIDIEKNKEIDRVKVEKKPYCVTFSSDGNKAFVTNQYSDSVSVIDVNSRLLEKNLKIGGFPEGIDSHDGFVYVVNWMDEELVIFNEKSFKTVGVLQLGANPRNFGKFIFW